MGIESFAPAGVAQRLAEILEAPLGFKNLLMNADWRINQRAFAGGALSAGVYGHDRWKADTSGATYTVANGVASITAGTLVQVIEGANIDNGIYVMSWEGTAACTINGTAIAKNSTVRLARSTDCTIRFSGGSVQRPQLERGRRATRFEIRPIALELSLCQRYFERLGGYVYEPIGIAQMVGTTQAKALVNFKVPKRTTPTISTGSATAWGVDHAGTVEASTAVAFSLISPRACQMTLTVASGLTNLAAAYVYGNNNALAYLDISAEL